MLAIRESIHLESIGGKNPLDVIDNRLIIESFGRIEEAIESALLHTFRTMDWSSGTMPLTLDKPGTPSATLTYMINDQFFENRIQLL